MLLQLLQAVIAVVLPAVAVYLATQLAKLNATIDALPGIWKQFLTAIEGVGFAALAVKLGISLPGTLAGFDPTVVQGLLSALVAWILHAKVGVSTGASD